MKIIKVSSKQPTQWLSKAWQIFMQRPLWFLLVANLGVLVQMATNFVPFLGGLLSLVMSIVVTSLVILCSYRLDQPSQDGSDTLLAMWSKTVGKQIAFVFIMWILFSLCWLLSIGAFVVSVGGIDMFSGLIDKVDNAMANPEDIVLILQSLLPSLAVAVLVFAVLSLPLIMMYWFSLGAIAIEEMKPLKAMLISLKLCVKNVWPFTWLSILLLFWLVLACLPAFVGLLVFNPIIMILLYTSYESFSEKTPMVDSGIDTVDGIA